MSISSEPGFRAVSWLAQGPSLPLQGLRILSFLILEESGETQWGQGSCLFFSQLSHGPLEETWLSQNSENGEELNLEFGGGGGRKWWQTE